MITSEECVARNMNFLGSLMRWMKPKLYKGDAYMLNIYWTRPHYQGAATFPWEYKETR